MQYICGPEHDKRSVEITLPENAKNIGVLVNSSIPSTLLYYLLLFTKYQTGSDHNIKPFLVLKNNADLDLYTDLLIKKILEHFPDEKNKYPIIINASLAPNVSPIVSGIDQILRLARMDVVYAGNRQKLPEFGTDPYDYKDESFIRYPFKDINGSHIIDLYYKTYIDYLLDFTHSCHLNKTVHCGNCDGCRERFWSFDQMGKNDSRFFTD